MPNALSKGCPSESVHQDANQEDELRYSPKWTNTYHSFADWIEDLKKSAAVEPANDDENSFQCVVPVPFHDSVCLIVNQGGQSDIPLRRLLTKCEWSKDPRYKLYLTKRGREVPVSVERVVRSVVNAHGENAEDMIESAIIDLCHGLCKGYSNREREIRIIQDARSTNGKCDFKDLECLAGSIFSLKCGLVVKKGQRCKECYKIRKTISRLSKRAEHLEPSKKENVRYLTTIQETKLAARSNKEMKARLAELQSVKKGDVNSTTALNLCLDKIFSALDESPSSERFDRQFLKHVLMDSIKNRDRKKKRYDTRLKHGNTRFASIPRGFTSTRHYENLCPCRPRRPSATALAQPLPQKKQFKSLT
jgi:hypothetical protein